MFLGPLKFVQLEFQYVGLSEPIFGEETVGSGNNTGGGSDDRHKDWDWDGERH